MADIKEDVKEDVEVPKSESQLVEEDEDDKKHALQAPRAKRVASLDIFRGLTVVVNCFPLVYVHLSEFFSPFLYCHEIVCWEMLLLSDETLRLRV